MRRIGPGSTRGRLLVLTAILALAPPAFPAAAAVQFTISGRKVAAQESNFAGVRHASPRYGLVVQINHDARFDGEFELTLVDEAYASLLQHHRGAAMPPDAIPVVFVSDAKMARFGEGGRRRIFRFLEGETRKHPDVHISPSAIFISDGNLADRDKLRSALERALSFLFDRRYREALDSIERPTPDR
jgi:hypothetical protein